MQKNKCMYCTFDLNYICLYKVDSIMYAAPNCVDSTFFSQMKKNYILQPNILKSQEASP